MHTIGKCITPTFWLGLSVTFLLNSIRFFEEARKQTDHQLLSRNFNWFVILFTIGLLLMGYFIGVLVSVKKQRLKK
jgi:hypothetical protein